MHAETPTNAPPNLRSVAADAATIGEVWDAGRAVLQCHAPGAAIALFMRCSVTGLWQQFADVEHSRVPIAKTFAAVGPALAHSQPLVRWGAPCAYMPLRNEANRVTGCIVLAFEGDRSLAIISEPALIEAAEIVAAELDRVRRGDEDRLGRRWRVAVQTLPRLAHAATSRENLLQIVTRTIGFIFPGAAVHVLFARDGETDQLVLTAGVGTVDEAVREGARGAMDFDRLQLSRPAGAATLTPDARQLAAAPLHDPSRRRAALVVEIPVRGRVLEAGDMQPLLAIGDIFALALDRLESSRAQRILEGNDPETGCGAAARLDRALEATLDRATAASASTALLLLEADPKKGDWPAIRIGTALVAAAAAEGAVAFRLRPQCFALLVADCNLRRARLFAQRLRVLVRDEHGSTASVGLAVAPLHAADAEGVRAAAEAAAGAALRDGPDADVVATGLLARDARRLTRFGERHEMLCSMARLVDEKHFGGAPRSQLVSARCREIAVLLRLSQRDVETARLAGELHAVGRALLPLSAFSSTTPNRLIASHALLGARLAINAGFPHVGEAIAAAHEAWDGTGQPNGLRGEAIPIVARILAAVACEATAADEPAAVRQDTARGLLAQRGKALDPRVVDVVLRRA